MITFNLSAPDRTLFSDTARDLALACTPDRDKKKKNATAQIRRFYDEVVFWHDRVLKESDPELGFQKAEPFIQMLKAKAHYANGRDLIDDTCLDFLVRLADQIRDVETLKNGKLLFESFLGYKKYFEEIRK